MNRISMLCVPELLQLPCVHLGKKLILSTFAAVYASENFTLLWPLEASIFNEPYPQ